MVALFAVVHRAHPNHIVDWTGAPFEGESVNDAEKEVAKTYGYTFLLNVKVVPMTPELEKQYKAVEAT